MHKSVISFVGCRLRVRLSGRGLCQSKQLSVSPVGGLCPLSVSAFSHHTTTLASHPKYCRKMSSKAPSTLFECVGTVGGGVTALTTGAPGPARLKKVTEIMQKSSEHLWKHTSEVDTSIVQYGPRQGSYRYRTELAKFLSDRYGDPVNSENLMVTSGATYGLHFAASVLLRSGAPVFVEDPTYFIAINLLKQDLGMSIVPMPTNDEQGVDLDALEKLLEKNRPSTPVTEKNPFWGIVYVVPTYNNPRGFHFPPATNRRLVELARKYDVLVFCDDVYNVMTFDNDKTAPPRLLAYDKSSDPDYKGHVISNGSFSKILSPGLRLGWIEAGPRILELLYKSFINLSAGAANHYASELVASALNLGLQQEYLKKMNAEYGVTVKAMSNVMRENLPKDVTFFEPDGGYFFWIKMPEGAKSTEVAKIAMDEYKIRILPGQNCSPTGSFQNCIRLSWSYYEEDVLLDATKKVCNAINKHLATLK